MKNYQTLFDRIYRLAESNPDNELTFLNAVLLSMTDHGFRSARFYEIIKDPLDGADVLILRAYSYENKKTRPPVGLRIPLHASTLGNEGLTHDVVVGTADRSPGSARDWIKTLNLENDSWADVAIRDFKSDLYGLLAVSMPNEYEFSSEDQFHLRLIRGIVAQYESNFRLRQIAKLKKSVSDFFKKSEQNSISADYIAEQTAQIVLPISGGQACAVFRYDWATRKLSKVAEQIAPSLIIPSIPESYYSGQYLTGAAWDNEELRHIPNFKSFMERRSTLVFQGSLDFHEKALGGIQSILYYPFGHRSLRFLVRVINRLENPALPLNYSHKEVLASICQEISEFTDEFANRMVIKEFEKVSTSGIRHITDYTEPLLKCCDALEVVGFGECAIIYKAKSSPQYELIHNGDGRLRGRLPKSLFLAGDTPFLTRLASETGMKISRMSDQRSPDDSFLNALRASGVVSVISACSIGDNGSILAVRCVYSSESKLSPGTSLFENVSDRDIIPALLSILAGVVEGSRLNVSADFAETLVAHFGHEVATPIAKLGSKALAAVNRAIKILREANIGGESLDKLEESKDSINSQSHQIHHQMKSAIALASKSAGALDVRFASFSWNEIIADAWEEAIDWRNSVEGRSPSRPVLLVKNAAIATMRSIGDRDLIRAILSNLFKNAIKYSLPRFSSRPIEVRVLGQPQSSVDIVQVENWGIGIPEEEWESIFQKFMRVNRTDRVRAIRGMGLGLYISRLYAAVHHGQLFCRFSRPTLDDPVRNKALEGFETAFELRVPKDQILGVRKIAIDEGLK